LVTNQVMKKIMVQNELTINVDDIDSLICEEISSLHI